MRLNKFLAASTALSRRGADEAIAAGRISVNGNTAEHGQDVSETDIVMLDGRTVGRISAKTTIILNKPRGYVVSRNGQGSSTIFEILPSEYRLLNPVGRLDKDTSGLLLLTNDGDLAQELAHPSHQKLKTYEVTLNKPLAPIHRQMICDHGLQLEDGPSRLELERMHESDDTVWIVRMHEGRNRQIRRTFDALGYSVVQLNRISFGPYRLDGLQSGGVRVVRQAT